MGHRLSFLTKQKRVENLVTQFLCVPRRLLTYSDVVVDALGPAVQVNQPVHRSQLTPVHNIRVTIEEEHSIPFPAVFRIRIH